MSQSKTLGKFGQSLTVAQVGFRNKLINGNFDFWQRGTSLAAAAAFRYLADRWVSNALGATVAYSQGVFALGQTGVPGEPAYAAVLTSTTSSTTTDAVTFGQRIEGARTLAGQQAVLSFWAKADANRNIAVEFNQNFGSGGSPSTNVNSIGVTTLALTTQYQLFKVPVTLPSIAGKTLGTNGDDNLEIDFWLSAGSNYASRSNSLGTQAGQFIFARVQLEAGNVATPFEQRPLGTELALCQRYYETAAIAPLFINSVTPIGMMFPIYYRATKRTVPTVTFTGITYYSNGTPTAISSGYNTQSAGIDSVALYINSGTTNMNGLAGGTYIANAEI